MKETDQEFEDLLHYLNLPAALGAPARSLRIRAGSVRVRPTSALSPNPAHEEPGAPTVTRVPLAARFSNSLICRSGRIFSPGDRAAVSR